MLEPIDVRANRCSSESMYASISLACITVVRITYGYRPMHKLRVMVSKRL